MIEQDLTKLTDAEIDSLIRDVMGALKIARNKAGRSERARYLAVEITDLEKVWAHFNVFVLNSHESQETPVT